ncbi:MAG: hypothetical protein Q9201_006023 [Fulgogasparrea decipioides]
MPLRFRSVSDLLEALEQNAASTRKAMKGWLDQRNKDTIESWVKSHKITVDSAEVDVVALLSAIFPEKRTDRVYSLQAPSLTRILGRCFGLGIERRKQLEEWKTPGRGDLGICVERTLRQTEHGETRNSVTLDEVDSTLLNIAAKNRFSAPGVREAAKDDGVETCKLLESIYRRLSSTEAKWFTRMILKDYSTLDFKSYYLLNAVDPRLVQALDVHATFEAAVGLLRHRNATTKGHTPSRAPLVPIVGSKIGRVPYLKGRSVKNAVQLAEGRKMSVERKYDGEYCQVHINLARGKDCIQIFSKSGKDSTADRKGVHEAIKQSLRIGQPGCKFSRRCILEGEMLVYNDLENRVSEFHKIRKHVSRSGLYLGTELDSQAHKYEHLMIAFYDVMLIDDDDVMNEPHTVRRGRLEELVTCIRGRANVAKQKIVDFSSSSGPEKLRTLLAHAFAQRWEGLVLKPSNAAYFGPDNSGSSIARCWIKLKKDYIPGLGDTADFAVVGAGYDATHAAQLNCPGLKWTHFHIGCLRNKKEVSGKSAKPYFAIVAALGVNREMAKHLNQHGQFCALPLGSLLSYQDPFVLDIPKAIVPMAVVFRKPFVFDVVGAGFDKEPNRDYFTLRFPRALKIHSDRDWRACIGFDELQAMAKAARTVSTDTKAEIAEWMKQLEQVDRGAKGSTVPWDLSDDDVETSGGVQSSRPTRQAVSRRSRRSSSAAAPMIRMDTEEMTDKEQRLDSGEVVRRPEYRSPISNWSESNLPTQPKSSPVPNTSTPRTHRALSSVRSTNSTDGRRKRSIDDAEESHGSIVPKRPRVSPSIKKTKESAGVNASTHHSATSKAPQKTYKIRSAANSAAPGHPASRLKQHPSQEPLLVPKLSVGAAEALRSRTEPRNITNDIQRSPDRQSTADKRSTEDARSTQQSTQESLIVEWQLPVAMPTPNSESRLPDLCKSAVVLSPCVSGMPYLTEDLLHSKGIRTYLAGKVLGEPGSRINVQPRSPTSIADATAQDVVILIEGRRHDQSVEMLKYLVGRVPEDRSQNMWVFDWRLVEDMFARGVNDDEKLREKRLIARFWYEANGELKWLTSTGELHNIPQQSIEESRNMSGAFLV